MSIAIWANDGKPSVANRLTSAIEPNRPILSALQQDL